MKISASLISTMTVGSFLVVGSLCAARTEAFTSRHIAVASTENRIAVRGVPADQALRKIGGADRLFELATSTPTNPCVVGPQAPKPVAQTNTKKKILSPTIAPPPCAPPGALGGTPHA